jgi:microcompartment protein CcmL/EutN
MGTPELRIILLHVTPLFDLGRILVTPGAMTLIASRRIRVEALLARHVTGDWGDVPAAIDRANRTALHNGGELISIYIPTPESEVNATAREPMNEQLWVVTDADRHVTTFLTPAEY